MDFFYDVVNGTGFSGSTIPISSLLLSLLMAAAIGQVVGWIYMWTHVSPSYSKSFSASLVTLPVIVALMMILMAGSTAIAFGLLAVFAVVRFRNVLKDTRDTTYILWAIVEGMGVGTLHYAESLCGVIVVGILLTYLWISDFGGRHQFDAVLSLELDGAAAPNDDRFHRILRRHAARWKRTGSQHRTDTGPNVTYRLLLRDPARSDELRTELLDCDDIQHLSLFVTDDQSET